LDVDNLSQYIAQQREAGTVESAGSFTLAIDKARDKLSTYSLANPEDYILKIVQCAVSLKVKTLHINFTRTNVLVYFELAHDDLSLSIENITNALLNPLEESNRARSCLALALCSIAGQEPTELMWGDWDAGDSNIILSLGHGRSELFRSVPFPRTEPLDDDKRLHLLFLKKSTTSKLPLSLTSRELSALQSRCSFAPVRIQVDGQPLGPSLPLFVSPSDPVSHLTSLYLGALCIGCNEAKTLSWIPAPESKTAQAFKKEIPSSLKSVAAGLPPVFFFDRPEHWTLPLESEAHFSEVLGIPAYLYGPSTLHYVKDGVMLAPITLHDAGGGAFAILDGDRLKTDVSGLQAIRDESVEADTERVVELWKKLVNGFVDGSPPIYHANILSSSDEAMSFLFGCCLLGPFAQLFRPVYDYLTHSARKRAMQVKRYHRQLTTRRGYIAYFRKSKPRKSESL